MLLSYAEGAAKQLNVAGAHMKCFVTGTDRVERQEHVNNTRQTHLHLAQNQNGAPFDFYELFLSSPTPETLSECF